MALNIVRVLALPDPLEANTVYMQSVSATEVKFTIVGNTAAEVRSTMVSTDILAAATADAAAKAAAAQQAAIDAAAADATSKANAAEAAAISAAAADATAKADAAEAAAVAAAALDATSKADAAQAAAATDATAKADAAQAAAIAAAALDATAKADAAEADAIAAAALDATAKADAAQAAAIAAAAADATSKANAAQANAEDYADSAIVTALGNLDLTNNAHLVANIDARDALQPSLTKSGFVLVVDATDDPTVDVGAALYFYDKVGDAFTKVSEYESLDLPNMDIVAKLSDIEGVLHYDGLPIGTVVEGMHDW